MAEEKPDIERGPDEEPSLTVAGIAHDVNQMLAVITGRTGLLLQAEDTAGMKPHLEAIELAARDAAAILRRLDPRHPLEAPIRAAVDLQEIVDQALGLVCPAGKHSVQGQNQVPTKLIAAVPGQVLREVLVNLLLNALAATPSGGRVTVGASDAGGQWLELWVVDTGSGLPSGDPEFVFTRGVTSSGDRQRGVGLAACRQLMESVGGTLTARNSPEGGALFALRVPAAGCEAAPDTSHEDPGTVPAVGVVVVDDEAVVREMLQDVLASWGCRVYSYRDGPETLQGHARGTTALALVDQNLPGMTGIDLIKRLREVDPDLYIVLMSGWQQNGRLDEQQAVAVDQHATKPLPLADLAGLVRAAHEKRVASRTRASNRGESNR